ncbi:MAG TPA: hypothetical protein VFS10_21790 [Pyrinomonadaceae bacterium]|nr:hypothetical protein [Pyrinomonadaceae bacterium]
MKSKATRMLRGLAGLALCLALPAALARAQQPTPSPQSAGAQTQSAASSQKKEETGNYTVTSSVEIGYRGLSVDGDINKYQSDLNYKAGPRLFDSSLLVQAKDGAGGPFDTLLVTTTGWGSDPNGHFRISMEKSKWYRLDGNYRRFKYFRFLNNIANPFYTTRPTDPATGQHGYDTRQQVGDFDLTLLPKNKRVRFNVGYSPTRYNGPVFTTWHYGGDDFMLLSNAKYRSNDLRLGADLNLGPVDLSFQQGFRRYKDESFIDDDNINLGVNPALSNAFLRSIERAQPIKGRVNYSRFSAHTLLAKKLDITGRIIHSSAKSDFNWVESVVADNFNTRITNIPGVINPPNVLTLGQFNFVGDAERPNTLGALGLTYRVTDRFRLSNTFRVETFEINGNTFYRGVFNLTRANGTGAVSIQPTGSALETTKYRKVQNTFEGDYEFDERYSVRLGYRHGRRHIETFFSGANLASNGAPPLPDDAHEEDNQTNTVMFGFKARPVRGWSLSLDADHGTSDNVFTRTGNYNFTNIRARSRYSVTRRLRFNLAFFARENANPSEIDVNGSSVSLADFGVEIKSRVFTTSLDWTANDRLSFGAGYNYNRQNSDAVIEYAFGPGVPNAGIRGHSLYFMRNHFFNFDVVAQPFRRVSLYAAYRVNKDTGQGSRISNQAAGIFISSYPMHYQSPEARVALRVNRRVDWNLGYQYYNYNESRLAAFNQGTFIVSPRPQNYHAHMPYTSLRFYFGGGER